MHNLSKWETILIELTGADIPATLTAVTSAGVELQELLYLDALRIRAWIKLTDYRKVRQISVRRGDSVAILRIAGISRYFLTIRKRPVLLIGILLLFVLSFYVPGKVFFIRVEGNRTVSTSQILEHAEKQGVFFGADRRALRSEAVKNYLLEQIPGLQWVGVNTYGCLTVISVEERTMQQEAESSPISSIVAARDGIITSFTVTHGNNLCKKGQAVRRGEVLVSAYTDTGTHIRVQNAQGEIFAQTNRKVEVLMPTDYTQKGDIIDDSKKIGIIFGKKRINFYNDSGILDPLCVKMYEEYYIVLPGGFQLPVALVVERTFAMDSPSVVTVSDRKDVNPAEVAEQYLLNQMISGKILTSNISKATGEMSDTFFGEYTCIEMIARKRNEESLDNYEQNN